MTRLDLWLSCEPSLRLLDLPQHAVDRLPLQVDQQVTELGAALDLGERPLPRQITRSNAGEVEVGVGLDSMLGNPGLLVVIQSVKEAHASSSLEQLAQTDQLFTPQANRKTELVMRDGPASDGLRHWFTSNTHLATKEDLP